MLGRKKRNRLQEDGFPEEEYPEEEYPEEILPENEYLTDGTETYAPVREADYDPENDMYPEEGPEPDSWTDDDREDGAWEDEPEEKPETRSIFRPDVRKPNFVLSVLVNTVRVLILVGMAPKSVAMSWIVLALAASYGAILYLAIFKLKAKKR